MSQAHGKRAVSWWGPTVPPTHTTGTATTYVGARLRFTVEGRVAGLRLYDDNGASVSYATFGHFIDDSTAPGRYLHDAVLYVPPATGAKWHQMWMRPWQRIVVGRDYWVMFLYVGGGFYRQNNALASPVTRNGIMFISGFQSTSLDPSNLTPTENTNANAVDVLFQPD